MYFTWFISFSSLLVSNLFNCNYPRCLSVCFPQSFFASHFLLSDFLPWLFLALDLHSALQIISFFPFISYLTCPCAPSSHPLHFHHIVIALSLSPSELHVLVFCHCSSQPCHSFCRSNYQNWWEGCVGDMCFNSQTDPGCHLQKKRNKGRESKWNYRDERQNTRELQEGRQYADYIMTA